MTLRDNRPDLSGGTVLAASLRHDEGRLRVVREEGGSRGHRLIIPGLRTASAYVTRRSSLNPSHRGHFRMSGFSSSCPKTTLRSTTISSAVALACVA